VKIAWAAGDTSRWWECDEEGPIDVPGIYWPTGAKYGFSLEALISAYETRGYHEDLATLTHVLAPQVEQRRQR
jgi:hypothetical protein